ncbi:NAD(P)-dependent alcohol dehydrogenase [Paremcibacter congregatus]|uniref:Alcohol dehydrogenase n=1 Tax=Paremcibacter congregatus TaxID=2043170 RepID=A0A2G4YVY0_9PROT|nr:NAD(P)-dependent alcohol dehydrogenase [Paremcibacter congregatus]PHZ86423.1 alcohol dehydrogenase [Paremcibacter congregatus]QDE28481.1 NAD(P)-dependent alcohol dehydrogenase [Paremcibacter congregatus]
MKAFTYHKYGSPEELTLVEVPQPRPKADELLIRIQATSLNASDWEILTGNPFYARIFGLFTPGHPILGSDIAGVVEAVGDTVTGFKVGDRVFGDSFGHFGGFAEYVCMRRTEVTPIPAGLSFAEASALPQAGVAALQALGNAGKLRAGQHVMINGGGGSVGCFAIQIAKRLGAEVTGVDHGGKLAVMRRIGADHVIDYETQDFVVGGPKFDLIVDVMAHRSILSYWRVLRPGGVYLMLGGTMGCLLQSLLLGPLISLLSSKKMGLTGHRQNQQDMAELARQSVAGELHPVIDRCYPFDQIPQALLRLGTAKAMGKVVIMQEKDHASCEWPDDS